MGEALARPERQTKTRLEVEEGDGAVLELLADDAVRREAEAVAVEVQRAARSPTPRVSTVMRGFMTGTVEAYRTEWRISRPKPRD